MILVDLIEYLENVGDREALISILLIMILQSPVLTFPGYMLMIYAGFKFGLLTGALINFLGLYASCVLGHRFGRWSSTDLSKNLNPRIQKFNSWVEEKGIQVVIFLRILPIIPNNIASIGSGFARLSEKQHAFYSGFSIVQSFFWSFLGSYLLRTVIGDLQLEVTMYHGIVLVLLIVFMFYVRYRYNSNKENNVTDLPEL